MHPSKIGNGAVRPQNTGLLFPSISCVSACWDCKIVFHDATASVGGFYL
jgi:hypothetical protein